MTLQHNARRSFNNWGMRSSLAGARTVLAALATLTACSGVGTGSEDFGAEDPGGDAVETQSRTDALFAFNQPQAFKSIGAVPANSTDIGDPAMCTPDGTHSKLVFTRDTSNLIQGIADVVGIQGAWGKYSGFSTRTFGGRPACGFLSNTATPAYPFVLLAKGLAAGDGTSDKRLFWSAGKWAISASAPPPVTAAPWKPLSSTHFNINGNPAVGTKDGQVVVVYLGDNGQILANYWLPGNNAFSSTVTGPTLPTGWTGIGTPAIHFAASWSGRFSVIVRAVNSSGQSRFYITFFATTSFQGAIPGSPAAYSQVVLPANAPAIHSDPAYEFDDNPEMNSATLYYRNLNTLYQVTANGNVYGFNESTISPLTLFGGTPNITGNPVAIGGVPYEQGRHWVLARGGNELYFAESYNDGMHLIPDRAACADLATPEQIFADGHIVGCAGHVTWAQRNSLCAPGSFTCSASAWHDVQATSGDAPTHNYWTNDELRYSGGSSACFASPTVGSLCPTGQPMRVCTATGSDPEGNVCNWSNCGYGANTPTEYFGGCSGNTTAGALCCR